MNSQTLIGEDNAAALITHHGAQIHSWRTADGVERLFLSRTASHQPGNSIRGGVPIIFPQFGGAGPLRHGFARTMDWSLVGASKAHASYELSSSDQTLQRWPHAFQLRYEIRLLHDRLSMTLEVENTGSDPLSFTGALHTYLRVANLDEAFVQGLKDRPFVDEVTEMHHIDFEPTLKFDGLIDRLYPDAAAHAALVHTGFGDIEVVSEGFKDVVLWNPGQTAAEALTDLHPGGYQCFVCVESAIVQTPAVVEQGEKWRGSQTLILRDSHP